MKKTVASLGLLISLKALCISGTKMLMGKDELGHNIKKITYQQKINLKDTFLVQSYGRLKSLKSKSSDLKSLFDLLFMQQDLAALKMSNKLEVQKYSEQRLVRATKLYLLFKLGMQQSFFNLWVEEVTKHNLLETELGVALDQIVGEKASHNLITHGVVVSTSQKTALSKIDNKDSLYHNSVEAYLSLRSGIAGLKSLEKLSKGDVLIYPLAKSAVTAMAIKGKLADAGHLVKHYLEPIIENSHNVDQISDYYILLARLLYQAKAYGAARDYYLKVPDESKHFLTARVELLWIAIRRENHSVLLGEIKSLDHFKEEYLPERYLVAAMANLKLCDFSQVHKSLQKYVDTNKSFTKLIERNLQSQTPKAFPQASFYRDLLQNSKDSLIDEMDNLKALNLSSGDELTPYLEMAKKRYSREVVMEWQNKKKLIQKSLRKMRFVKIEFLSAMRRFKNHILENQDSVSSFTSGIDKNNKLEFPYDGVLFGDELFHLYSRVQRHCLGVRSK